MSKRICVVGAGRWGRNHIRTLHDLRSLSGIVELDSEVRSRMQSEYPNARVFGSLQESFAYDFDGYVVATPAETHFPVASEIISRKRPVLVEKPLALSVADARQLERLGIQHGVGVMVGHLMLFHPAICKMKELIDVGKLGRLQYLYSNRLNLGTVRKEENILWSFAPHDISIFQYLIGSRPQKVSSHGAAFLRPSVHDSTITVLSYPGNIEGHIFVSWLHPFKEHRIVAIGSKGMLSYEDSSPQKQILFYEKGIDWVNGELVSREGATAVIDYDKGQPLELELVFFLNNLKHPTIAINGPKSGIEVLEILEQATNALRTEADRQPDPSARTQVKDYFVHPTSIVDDGVEIDTGTKIWHFSHIQTGARIGRDCSIGQNVNVANNVVIGNSVKIQNNVSIYEGVELEDYVFCGPSMVFTNVMNPRSKYPQRGSSHYHRTLVREGASLGANCTVVCGLQIGRHAFVAAGAVVTKDVSDFALVAGVPARQIGWICECGTKLPNSEGKKLSCPKCKLGYARAGNNLVQISAPA